MVQGKGGLVGAPDDWQRVDDDALPRKASVIKS